MATREDVIAVARGYLRDFPRFFQTAFVPTGRTYELGKPNVDPDTLWVGYVPTAGPSVSVIPTSGYALDERNGLLRLTTTPAADTIMVEGYYYEWLTTADMEFYADMSINAHLSNIETPLEMVAPIVLDVIGQGALVEALWGLLSEYSRDIDVITSESVHIIASQRYRMVENLLQEWLGKYKSAAAALNIGLERMEMFTLRRVSKTTGRYVPEYKAREIEDYGPIERIWPNIDKGFIDLEEKDDDLRDDVFVTSEPPPGFLTNGSS